MAGEAAKINVPEPPNLPGLPESKRRDWRETYAKAFKQALIDHPADEIEQRATAMREANRIFSVDEPANYKDAMALADWQVLYRAERDGHLKVVTIDAKKYSFPIPEKAVSPADDKGKK